MRTRTYNRNFVYLAGPMIGLLGLLGNGIACTSDDSGSEEQDDSNLPSGELSAKSLLMQAQSFFKPLPKQVESEDNELSDEKVDLGRMLYYDPRLSLEQDISCNTCHLLDKYGVDGLAMSVGHKGQTGDRNAPTVYNAALFLAQFWDGRSPDVEDQAKGPVLNPIEMAMESEESVVEAIQAVDGYQSLFDEAFPEERGSSISFDNMAKAIAAFERKLVTPSKFDEFLDGSEDALDEEELKGLQLFMDIGCSDCHLGAALGGQGYEKIGINKDFETEDTGRFKVTDKEEDKYVFKVPTLRNIAETGPYLHDGSIKSLDEMVDIMVEYQTEKGTLSEDEKSSLIVFLESLTGEIPSDFIKEPDLPK